VFAPAAASASINTILYLSTGSLLLLLAPAALAAHKRSCTYCADDVNCPSTFHITCTCVSYWTFSRAGHSLGGALATLAAYDIQAACKCLPKKGLSVYTFGAPRVGNHAFARDYNQAVFETWNVINGK